MSKDKNSLESSIEELVKKKHKRELAGIATKEDDAYLKPGDNTRYLLFTMKVSSMGKIDLFDNDAVMKRLDEYFYLCAEHDMKPTVVGMGLAVGLDRRRLWEIKTGNFVPRSKLQEMPQAVLDTIKKGYDFMENLWESYMINGKINPVSGIFLGKNNFNYRDQTEYVVTPNRIADDDYNVEEINKRYLPDGEATLEENE